MQNTENVSFIFATSAKKEKKNLHQKKKRSKAFENCIYSIGFKALQTAFHEGCLNTYIKYFSSLSVRI